MKPRLGAQLMAEFLGTMVILLFGNGVVAMTVLFGSGVPGEIVKGGYTNVTLCWALGVTLGVLVAERISGAHLNPAVTLALACYRGFPWGKVLPYVAAQLAGATCGAALVLWNYWAAIVRFDPKLERTAGIFTTFPEFPSSPAAGFLDQTLGTALLVLLVFAIIEERNPPLAPAMAAILVGAVVAAIGMSFGALHGYAINPARDFGPRLLVALAGFQGNGLTDGGGWWIPVAGPLAGALLGGAIYDFGIRRSLRD